MFPRLNLMRDRCCVATVADVSTISYEGLIATPVSNESSLT